MRPSGSKRIRALDLQAVVPLKGFGIHSVREREPLMGLEAGEWHIPITGQSKKPF